MARRAHRSPLTPPEVALKRSLRERLDILFEEANIRRFDTDLLDKAEALLDVASDDSCDDDSTATKTVKSHYQYCMEKADFLLDLCSEDSDDENLNISKKWRRKADILLDLANESQSDEDPFALDIIS